MDYLTRLEDNNQDFFSWLDILCNCPETDPDWDLHTEAPSDEELALMDANAQELLIDLESEEDENC